MSNIVYIDMLFLLNFLIDSIILYSTSLLLKKNVSVARLFCSATVMALYSCFMFFPNIDILFTLTGKFLMIALGTFVAFPSNSLKLIIKNTAAFFCISAVFGGVLFAVIFATNFGTTIGATISNGELYFEAAPSTILFSVVLSYICIYIISYIKKQFEFQCKNTVYMEIGLLNMRARFKAFADTGCALIDPITNNNVIIISPQSAKKIIPDKLIKSLTSNFKNLDLGEYTCRYRLIPYSTINTNTGFLHGFVPDKIILNETQIPNCTIAISPNPLAIDFEVDALFNPMLLEDCCIKKERKFYNEQQAYK